jgi:rhamnogalacturonan endolyase
MKPNLVVLSLVACACAAGADEFVLIRGGVLPGAPQERVDDFEMGVAPVTNRDYEPFVRGSGAPAPLHWPGGRIPAGMEDHPVIFVNRFDAAAYARWRTAKEGRIYRLPTRAEFDYAARAGDVAAVYPWGKSLPEGVNYDPRGERTFAQWREFLRPVKSSPANRWGLHDMAGNVWQMADSYPDLAVNRFVYRVTDVTARESSLAGGSWARGEYYLRCGVWGGASAGIRHPDIGFRLVREPAGAAHFRNQARRVVAVPAEGGAIFLSWQLLAPDDAPGGFHVYRSRRRDGAGARITAGPVTGSTNYVDPAPERADRVYYRVRAVGPDGREGPPSEWAGADPAAAPDGLVMRIEPTVKTGGYISMFGDLDGDGVLDAVLRLDNGITEMSRDPGVPVELEAFTSYGRSLWRRPLVRHDHCFGSASNVPVNVYDLDGDGKAEVICRLQEGEEVFLAVLDGMTGRVLRKTPWRAMVSDFAKSSTRIHLSVAHLDAGAPSIVTQTGLYENEVIDAYDAALRPRWKYESFAETNGSGSHHIDIADVDGDGRDEVFNGTMLLNADGTLRWALYREHPDIVAVAHILPGVAERQVYYVVESSVHAGVYVVDASSGKLHWKVNREDDPRWTHGHTGWAADIWDGSPGLEMLANRDGHLAQDLVLFAAGGRIVANPFERGWRPVNWTGGPVRDLMSDDGRRLGRFDGRAVAVQEGAAPNPGARGSCRMVADLAGDFRDEVVCFSRTPEGAQVLLVYTNTRPVARREVTRVANREYRLWMARNMGGGYPSYFPWEPAR